MATDATGTPTFYAEIPTYETSEDRPSGAGFNAAMAALDAFLQLKLETNTTGTGNLVRESNPILSVPTLDASPGAADDTLKIITSEWFWDNLPSGSNYNRPWIDVVADYSADNTGTNDVSTAIQNAFNAAAQGQTVLIPKGTYKLSSTVTVPPGINIQGMGISRHNATADGAIFTGTANPMWQFTAANPGQQKISNLKFNPSSTNHIWKMTPTSVVVGLVVDNVAFIGSGSTRGVWLVTPNAGGGLERCLFMNCYFYNCGNGVRCDRGLSSQLNAHFDKTTFFKCFFENAGAGVQILIDATYIRAGAIRDCTFHGGTSSLGSIKISGQIYDYLFDGVYTENMCRGAGTNDDIVVARSTGSGAGEPLYPSGLVFQGCHLSTGTTSVRYAINLADLGGVWVDTVKQPSARLQGVHVLNGTVKYSTDYTPSSTCLTHVASNFTSTP